MVKTIFRIIGLTLLVSYLLVAGILFGFWREEPSYKGMKVVVDYPNDEAHFVSESSIRQLVLKKPGFKYLGKGYTDVNTLELSRYIENHNRLVRHASCVHTPDSLLRIDIEQRNPIIRIQSQYKLRDTQGNTFSDFYVDLDGEMMPVQHNAAIRLPLVSGFVRSRDIAPLREFALFLADHEFWRNEVTQIYVRENGDVELTPRIGNHTILLGPLTDYEKKLKRVKTFYAKVLPRKGWNAYRVINAKFDGQIVGEK